MLISNKLHSFRNFFPQRYQIFGTERRRAPAFSHQQSIRPFSRGMRSFVKRGLRTPLRFWAT